MRQLGGWWGSVAVPLLVGVYAIALCVQGASSQGLKDAELRRQYEALTEQRFDNDERRAHDFREDTTRRLDLVETAIGKNTVALRSLVRLSDDIHFLKRWIWVPVSVVLVLLWGACRKCWALGWKYGVQAWEWLMHLHECMDLTRATVEKNAKESAIWRAKTDRTLHKHGAFLMGIGLDSHKPPEDGCQKVE